MTGAEVGFAQTGIVILGLAFLMGGTGLYIVSKTFLQIYETRRGLTKIASNQIRNLLIMAVVLLGLGLFGFTFLAQHDVWQTYVMTLSDQVITAMVVSAFAIFLFLLNWLVHYLFPLEPKVTYAPLVLLSLGSGLAYTFMIFVINQALAVDRDARYEFFVCFAVTIGIYFVSQRYIRSQMVRLSNLIVYEKRMDMIHKLLHSRYQNVEAIGGDKILTCINNDVETISNFVNLFVSAFTSIVIVFFGFVYLGWINIYGFLFSFAIILASSALYFVVARKGNQLTEETRSVQHIFFKFIHDLVKGFRELTLHWLKKQQFAEDLKSYTYAYMTKRVKSSLMYSHVILVGELLFVMVIGAVVFLFPFFLPDSPNTMLREYVFIFLYLTGHVSFILNSVPEFMRFRISWNRLKQMEKQMGAMEIYESQTAAGEESAWSAHTLELMDVIFSYQNADGESFTVGPINCRFESGEIVFITGGNGSGKSTLAKLITGLYVPVSGEIVLNGRSVGAEELSQHFSAVFGEYHLFDRLYGIDSEEKHHEIENYLTLFGLKNKVELQAGRFTTTQLSTGQRKRLALMQCMLEERPFCLLDEWAADQDPQYRQFFYEVLLPDMRRKGTCIICITHDDRYFQTADTFIHMELGRIEKYSNYNKVGS
ncbi:cyclic peptide export ABC transporter [Paenibacillus caseinilyticus]|nr:cyclic peptide export ABC transporter [Paenibacillus caseinilyticus]MCZ8518258.1 cyclic peptide export ABC transporter [Paenibacillus caseinilyticus]